MTHPKLSFLILVFACFLLAGCASVKPYQKARLNDENMSLSSSLLEGYEKSALTFREGAAGANGGKVGGGCGCN